MRVVTLCLCILVLTVVASGQVTAPPTPEAEFTSSGQMWIEGGQIPPNGKTIIHAIRAEIRIGDALITADEADENVGAIGQPSEFELRGSVHLKAIVKRNLQQ
jgi:hypothetical protein